MLQYSQCKIDYRMISTDVENIEANTLKLIQRKLAKQLHVAPDSIKNLRIEKRSVDARKKPEVYYNYTVVFTCHDEEALLQKNRKNKNLSIYVPQPDLSETIQYVRDQRRIETDSEGKEGNRVVIVGSGPAGLMCAYFLALCGRKPIVIERGAPIWERVDKVNKFWEKGELDVSTNVSFGEGGAGTFSDGKLNTGVKDKTGKKAFILDAFIRHGAPEEIRYLAKPHIGTDKLREVIRSMRETIVECGGTYMFHTQFTGFVWEQLSQKEATNSETKKQLAGIYIKNEEGDKQVLPCGQCVLAIGHSARDTFEQLKAAGICMERKAFAVGVRVEHLQKKINEEQYGVEDARLPAADYKLTGKTSDGRGVYSFCMCPGGYVVNASTERGMTAVNGMSNHARDAVNANSAIIVTVNETDFESDDVLAGMEFQRELERRTFLAGNGRIPVQRFGDFVEGRVTERFGTVTPSTKGGYVMADVKKILPFYIADGIMEGMRQFGMKIKGFDDEDTLILGTETRTSSPVRIVRNESLESVCMRGVYPCGEGAGYAGGIMSAAMDGLRVALRLVGERNKEDDAERL